MKSLSKVLLAFLAVSLIASARPSEGATIDGAITFSGGAVFDTKSLAKATKVKSFSNVVVTSRDGDFASFVGVGAPTSMPVSWTFSPSTPTPGLWSVGGFTFDLLTSTVVFQDSHFIGITGTGTISGNGFDPTSGIWTFSSQSPGAHGVFSFSASGAAAVPDGGTTGALLGVALAGVEAIRRKLASA